MKIITPALLVCSLLLSSCASIVSKSSYPVSVRSTPSEANFVIRNHEGQTIHSGKTPSVVTLKASRGYFKAAQYTITYSKKGFPTRTHQVSAKMDGWYIGNVVFGGLIGMLVVDPLTGSMWALKPEQHAQLATPSTASLVIRPIQSLTVAERERLVPVTGLSS